MPLSSPNLPSSVSQTAMASDNRNYDPIEDMAIVEVGKVLEAVRKHGAYSSVVFDDPVTQTVIVRTYGGWPRLCSECDAKGFRREFVRTWAAYCRQEVEHFGYLPGIHESTNRSNGYYEYIPPPRLIGDPEIARAVLEAGQQMYVFANRPKVKPETSGAARVEYYACRDEVDAWLAQGYNPKRLYEYLKEQGKLTCGLQAFCDNIKRER